MSLWQWHKVAQASWNAEVGMVEQKMPKLGSKDPPLKSCEMFNLVHSHVSHCPLKTPEGSNIPNTVYPGSVEVLG